MATVQQLQPVPASDRPRGATDNGLRDVEIGTGNASPSSHAGARHGLGSGPQRGDTRIVVIMYGPGQDKMVSVFAEVLGKQSRLRTGFKDVAATDRDSVVGIPADDAKTDISSRDRELVVAINAHCVDLGMPPDALLSARCDYEFLYTETPFFRRDLCRFISHILGQLNHHDTLMAKPRTYFISTTFPDVRAALPNLDILTVGADAVEIRVDLLREPLGDGSLAPIPSLRYVGEQVMLLRQRTELPIIFTTRCTRENGRFPMRDPELYYEYLYRAIQWGVEYIDVELWLPEAIRERLYRQRGSSRIMSAFHDFSGTFKWLSRKAETVFAESCRYADIVKMIAIISDHHENFELEYFRSKIRADYPGSPPLSAVNMGEVGQFSRTLNRVFSPITHPLLPIIAAPGQLSAAEINQALALLGQLPRRSIYGIGSPSSRGRPSQAPFYEKCLNELGLPHHFAAVERQPRGYDCIEAWCGQKNFGGAYLSPPVSYASLAGGNASLFASAVLSEAARVIGMVDTVVVRPGSSSSSTPSAPTPMPSSPRQRHNGGVPAASQSSLPSNSSSNNNQLILDNASWRGILSTLTRDLAPSAYFGRAAVVLASSSDDAASVIYALRALKVGKIYTVGFKTPAALAGDLPIEPFNSLESLQRARMVNSADSGGGSGGSGDDGAGSPFVIVSALGPEKSNLVGMLVRVFGSRGSGYYRGKVFLDLADDGRAATPRRGNPSAVAEQSGFAAYGAADVTAFTTVETLRLLVGQNVPYSFVRLASGSGLY